METLVPSSKKETSKPSLTPRTVYEALVRVVGRERAEVVDFYIDSRLAFTDPERYERAVESLLGEGGRVVMRAMKSELAKSGRVEGMANESISREVRAIEKRFVHSRVK